MSLLSKKKGRLKCLALDIGEVEKEGWSFSGLRRKGLISLFFYFLFDRFQEREMSASNCLVRGDV